MTIEKNDPRLTAFVLGELPEAETQELQTAIDNDAELKNEVDAIRRTVAEIEEAMKNESIPGEPKVSTSGMIDKPETKKKWKFRITPVEVLVVVSIVFVLIALMNPALQKAGRHHAGTPTFRDELAAVPAVEQSPIENVPHRYSGKSLPTPHYMKNRVEHDAVKELRGDAIMSQPLIVPESNAPASAPPISGDGKVAVHGGAIYLGDPSVPKAEHVRGTDFLPATPSAGRRAVRLGSPAPARGFAMDAPAQQAPGETMAGGMGGKGNVVHVQSGKAEDKLMMMVEPKIIEQEEEEIDSKKHMSIKVYPTSDLVTDPYNSAKDEAYKSFVENEFKPVKVGEFSTFSIDVDTAAYTTMRRYIESGQRPPAASVRLEEYVNYFKYDYTRPTDGKPFATHVDVSPCPWEPKHLLARIGIKGKELSNISGAVDERPPLNLVFLIDTSGSMEASNRLPLVKRALTELVEMLQPKDRVAIVTYAGSSRVALPSVSGQEKRAVLDSIDSLGAGGGTAGAQGIKTAYQVARKYYDKKAQNRVVLCTDGDFNIGETNNKSLETMIGEEAKSGVFLTILGFGMGNYKDERLKTLSMRGNGNYGYVDNIEEARRLLVEGLTGTLFAIAKDVKIQVDFNPARVAGYRLLGYENRKLRDEDFHNDKIDAGEIGAGHTVTALYEIVPVGQNVPAAVDQSRYGDVDHETPRREETTSRHSEELMFVKLRYKQPDADKSSLLEYPVVYKEDDMSPDSEFAAAVALYGMLLRQSRYSGNGTFDGVLELATPNVKGDPYRQEFVELVKKAKELK